MTTYATVAEVRTLHGPMTDEQTATATDLLVRASAMLRGRVPGMDARIDAGTLDPVLASTAVVGMVLRVLANPRGVKSTSAGPYSTTWDSAVMSGLLQVRDEDLALVAEAPRAGSTFGVGTIMVRPGMAARPSAEVVRVRRW